MQSDYPCIIANERLIRLRHRNLWQDKTLTFFLAGLNNWLRVTYVQPTMIEKFAPLLRLRQGWR